MHLKIKIKIKLKVTSLCYSFDSIVLIKTQTNKLLLFVVRYCCICGRWFCRCRAANTLPELAEARFLEAVLSVFIRVIYS